MASSGVTVSTSNGEAPKPGFQVAIKQNGAVIGQGTVQGDGSVNAGGMIYRPTSG